MHAFFSFSFRVFFSFQLCLRNIFFSEPPNPTKGPTGVKTEDATDANNKRPISLLSTFDRILKRMHFINDKTILLSSQYGLREGFSTEQAGRR